MIRGKRQAPITLHADERLKAAIRHLARREDRTVSSWLVHRLENDPMVQVVVQQIEGRIGTQ